MRTWYSAGEFSLTSSSDQTFHRRLAVLSEIFPPVKGGSGKWLYEIYRRFPNDTVRFVVGEHEDATNFDAHNASLDLHRMPIHLVDWGTFKPRSCWRYVKRLFAVRRCTQEIGIDEVHAARVLPEGWIAYLMRKLFNLPFVVYVHGEDVSTATWSREHKFMVQRVLNNAKMIVANSQNTARVLERDYGVECQLLYPGVDTGYYIPSAPDIRVRSRLGWGDRPTILTVGRLQRRKGHDNMIRALQRLKQEFPNVLYAICGKGEEEQNLLELTQSLKLEEHVLFMGETSDHDLLCAYQQSTVFALPNREVDRDFEGFGMVLVEAQSCARPVLAGDSGGTRETMVVGKTGLIVDCTDVGRIADAVSELLSDPGRCVAMGEHGRKHVVSRFDWEPLASQSAQLFLGENRAR